MENTGKVLKFLVLVILLVKTVTIYGAGYIPGNITTISNFSGYGPQKEWHNYSGIDTVYDTTYQGSTAIKIISTNCGQTRIEKSFLSNRDFSTTTRFGLKCALTNVDSMIAIYVSTDNYAGYAYLTIQPSALLESHHDYNLIFEKFNFEIQGIGFDWKKVDKIRVDYQAKKGTANSLTCWDLYAETTTLSKGVVIFTFDDGWKSQYDSAFPIMQKYGIKGTFSVIVDAVKDGWGGKAMSLENLKIIKNAGNEICSHTYTHVDLTTISPDSAVQEVSESKTWLQENGLVTSRSAEEIIYPYGTISDSEITQIQSLHSIGLSTQFIPTRYLSTPIINQMFMPRLLVYTNDNSADITSYIDTAIKYKVAIILGFHGISGNDNETETRWPRTEFETLCIYINNKISSGELENPLISSFIYDYPGTGLRSRIKRFNAVSKYTSNQLYYDILGRQIVIEEKNRILKHKTGLLIKKTFDGYKIYRSIRN